MTIGAYIALLFMVFLVQAQQHEFTYLKEEPNLLIRSNLELLNQHRHHREVSTFSKIIISESSASIRVHVKLYNQVIMTSNVLTQLARLMGVQDYRDEFEFRSSDDEHYIDMHKIFTTRLTLAQLSVLGNNKFIQEHVEWIKKVPEHEKVTFSKLNLEDLKFGDLQIHFGKNQDAALWLNHVKNWFQTQYINTWMKHFTSIHLLQALQMIDNSPNSDIKNLMHDILPTQLINDQDVNRIQHWFEEKFSFYFGLRWNLKENGRVHISLENLDTGVWNLIQKGKFDHPSVKTLRRREIIEQAMKMVPSISNMWNDISENLGEQLLSYLKSLDSVDYITRGVTYQVDNYGSNQVIQSGGTNNTYFWNYGITGNGELIAVTDTGVNVNHCFFSGQGEIYTTLNLNNRKIVYIDTQGGYGNTLDDTGHGSHCAGTIAGNPSSFVSTSVNNQIGVARDAKLYVVDAQLSGSSGLTITDLKVLLPRLLDSGVRVSSNSWSCQNPYTCDYDCKCYTLFSNGTKAPVDDSSCIAYNGKRCCHHCNLYNSQSVSIDSVLNKNDELTYVTSVGNYGVYSYDSTVNDPATAKNAITVGSSYSTTEYYKLTISQNVNTTVYNMENLSSFSSRGPTVDGRIKPDIVAPGQEIYSTHFNTTCNIRSMSGTSMSTPAVAGAAALIRQYLTQNNNQKLVALELYNKNAAQTLSGSLVKALLIHSAEKMNGLVSLSSYLDPQGLSHFQVPNHFYGYGRVNLKRVLKIEQDPNSVALIGNIGVVNRMSLEPDTNTSIEVMTTSPSSTIKVTLVWYDLPGPFTNMSSTVKRIVNDMDLKVTIGTVVYFGNMALTNNANHDSTNTVESVTIENIPSQTNVSISVSSKATNKGAQTYSLVVSGNYVLKSAPIPYSGSMTIHLVSNMIIVFGILLMGLCLL
ncbi:hypothetical protein C9374_008687 [Naegleria lovaniensis]|uniref:Peptidase S8/S53 domain-containing protein n=1 Tax=Naegleria lovaniensis TaxID=51637 RepID=A0AA88GJQ7_NAELO|nr:uncharacterized protein C9374_008687 [Naegleria lovaniensis]KAG2378065.1 hypothetical protein C9374_008687 [Naegleria lovaniensis]